MEGTGDLLGGSVEAVRRRPWPAVVPALAHLLLLTATAAIWSLRYPVGLLARPGPPRRFDVTLPGPLPLVTDVQDVAGAAWRTGAASPVAVLAVLLALLPLVAYLQGGFLHLLRRVHGLGRPDEDPPEELPHAREAVRVLHEGGARTFRPLLAWNVLAAAAVLLGLAAEERVAGLADLHPAALVLEGLLLLAPFLIVLEGRGPLDAMGRSVELVLAHPGRVLLAILVGLLSTGGVHALVGSLVLDLGIAGLAFAGLLWAPVGTVWSLLLLRLTASLGPDPMPSDAEAEPHEPGLEAVVAG